MEASIHNLLSVLRALGTVVPRAFAFLPVWNRRPTPSTYALEPRPQPFRNRLRALSTRPITAPSIGPERFAGRNNRSRPFDLRPATTVPDRRPQPTPFPTPFPTPYAALSRALRSTPYALSRRRNRPFLRPQPVPKPPPRPTPEPRRPISPHNHPKAHTRASLEMAAHWWYPAHNGPYAPTCASLDTPTRRGVNRPPSGEPATFPLRGEAKLRPAASRFRLYAPTRASLDTCAGPSPLRGYV